MGETSAICLRDNLDTASGKYLASLEEELNNTPRKCLGYLTPNECLAKTQEFQVPTSVALLLRMWDLTRCDKIYPIAYMSVEVPNYLKGGVGVSVDEKRVAVVGAGIAGLAASIELAKRGYAVDVFERSEGRCGPERSEMTHGDLVSHLGLEEAVTTPLNAVYFVNLDRPERRFWHALRLDAEHPLQNFAVAIDHWKFTKGLLARAALTGKVSTNFGVNVCGVEEIRHNDGGVYVFLEREDSAPRVYRSVVLSTGPRIDHVDFPNKKREDIFANSAVCFAYGKRCRGRILCDNGETCVMHPISVESGKTSWICAAGPDEIDVVASSYARRRDVDKVPKEQMYERLKTQAIRLGLVEIKEEGPAISGFFGLEGGYSIPTGWKDVFAHGELAQFNKPGTGDAIRPSVVLSELLAETIAGGGSADDYTRAVSRLYDYALENALTHLRFRASSVGGAMGMLEMVKRMSDQEVIAYLEEMKPPLSKMLPVLIKDRGASTFALSLLVDTLKWRWRMSSTILTIKSAFQPF